MKKILLVGLVLSLLSSPCLAAQETILGGSGVLWGDEKVKINSNFTQLWGWLWTTWTPTGTIDLSGATVTFGLETTDIPDLSASYDAAGAAAAVIAAAVTESDTTHCPDGASVFTALAGKQASGSYLTEETDPNWPRQADCSAITSGCCLDTDNGYLYCWDGDTVEEVARPGSVDLLTFSAAGFVGSDGAGNWDDYYLDSANFENTSGTWGIKNGGILAADIGAIAEQKDWAILTPADADDTLLFKAQRAITITDIHCIVDPAGTGESIAIEILECDGTGDNCATVDAAITCDNDGAEDDGTLTNGAIDAGDWVQLLIGAPTGTVSSLVFSVYYTEDK